MKVETLQNLIRIANSRGIYFDYQDCEDDVIAKILIMLMEKS